MTDGDRFVYILGGDHKQAIDRIERYDVVTGEVVNWQNVAPFKGIMLTACFMKTGPKKSQGAIFVLTSGRLYSYQTDENPLPSQQWQEWTINQFAKELSSCRKQGFTQLSPTQLIVYGGENSSTCEDTDSCYVLNLSQ